MGSSTSRIAEWSCGGLATGVLRVLAPDAGCEGGIGYSNGLGMLVCGMMLFGMDLFVLLEVLRALERFLANLAAVRLERSVYLGLSEQDIGEEDENKEKG